MPSVYSAVKRFDPPSNDWDKFIAWSGLTQLREVVSLDDILCPNIFNELTAEDWKHNVHVDCKTHLFLDLDYLLGKVAGDDSVNVLALMENPAAEEVASFGDQRFVFRGFDLLDEQGGNSALVNCGGFEMAFSNVELSEFGLITDIQRAFGIRQVLREHHPNEHHAICDVWAVWQKVAR